MLNIAEISQQNNCGSFRFRLMSAIYFTYNINARVPRLAQKYDEITIIYYIKLSLQTTCFRNDFISIIICRVARLGVTVRFIATEICLWKRKLQETARKILLDLPKCTPLPVCSCGRRRCALTRKTQTRTDAQCHGSPPSRVIWNNRMVQRNLQKRASCSDIVRVILFPGEV